MLLRCPETTTVGKPGDPPGKQDLRKPEKWIELPGNAEKFFL
jgi:hypothetical protein